MIIKMKNRLFQIMASILPGGNNLRPNLHRLRGVKIGNKVWIGQYVYIDENHPETIKIGNNCTISLRTSIYAHMYFGPRNVTNAYVKGVIIEDNVFIGPHCLILPGVRIGEGSVLKGGTVVSRNVPSYTLWGFPSAGPIAKITVPLNYKHTYQEFIRGLRPIRKKKS